MPSYKWQSTIDHLLKRTHFYGDQVNILVAKWQYGWGFSISTYVCVDSSQTVLEHDNPSIHIYADSSRTVLKHHRFSLHMCWQQPSCTRAPQILHPINMWSLHSERFNDFPGVIQLAVMYAHHVKHTIPIIDREDHEYPVVPRDPTRAVILTPQTSKLHWYLFEV